MSTSGLWDVFTNQECVNWVRRKLYSDEGKDLASISEELVAKAIERGSSDNISVLICCLNQIDVAKTW